MRTCRIARQRQTLTALASEADSGVAEGTHSRALRVRE